MKVVKRVLLLLGLILILPGSLTFTQGMPEPDVDIPPGVVEKLGLSKEQKQRLEKLQMEMEKENIKVQAELRIKRLELKSLLDEENPNRKEIDKKVQEIGGLHTQLLKNKVYSILELKKVLTPEQEEKLKTMRRQFQKPGLRPRKPGFKPNLKKKKKSR